MAIPAVKNLAKTANVSAREIAGEGRAAGEHFAHHFINPTHPQMPKPKVEKLPKVSSYGGAMMRGRAL